MPLRGTFAHAGLVNEIIAAVDKSSRSACPPFKPGTGEPGGYLKRQDGYILLVSCPLFENVRTVWSTICRSYGALWFRVEC